MGRLIDTDDLMQYAFGHRKGLIHTADIDKCPTAQPTLFGYDIEHLKIIATVLRKENMPPDRVAEALMDIGRIVEIIRNEFEETFRKAVERYEID